MRRTAREIFRHVENNAHDELRRSPQALAFSGLAGGLSMGLTGLGVAAAMSALGDIPARDFIAYMLYPVGFIAVIIGRAQLFTENTLYPVALILSERRQLPKPPGCGRWYSSATCWAPLPSPRWPSQRRAEPADSFPPGAAGRAAAQGSGSHIFWSGVIGGWIIALVAWLVTASHWTIGQIAVIWLLTFVVGIGHFAHCIASTGEIMSAVFAGVVPFTHYLYWLGLATAGNIFGGVMIVTLLNFGQVKAGEDQ